MWIQQVLVGLSSSFPINYSCYDHTAVGKYCTLCSDCWMAWVTMEISFVYFLIVKWTLHSACFTSSAMIQIYILGSQLIKTCLILNNSPIIPSKSLLKSPSGEGNHSLPRLTWFDRSNLIGWFLCYKRFHWLTEYWVKKSGTLRVPSHLTMYSWQSVHLC